MSLSPLPNGIALQQIPLHVKRDPDILVAPGKFVVITGPSGSGKGTLSDYVRREPMLSKLLGSVKSIKTRNPRGLDEYRTNHFLTPAAFQQAIREGKLFEWGMFANQFYGRYLHEVLGVLKQGLNFLLEFAPPDAMVFKHTYPEKTSTVFVSLPAPELENTEKRLRDRRTETEEEIQLRLQEARAGYQLREQADLVLYNEDNKLHEAEDILKSFILENINPCRLVLPEE